MRLEAILTASVAAMVLSGCATTYPVKDAKAAIAVAKDICHEKPSQAGDWRAFERIEGGAWVAIEHLPGGTSHYVLVPKNGPFPSEILTCRLVPVLRPQT